MEGNRNTTISEAFTRAQAKPAKPAGEKAHAGKIDLEKLKAKVLAFEPVRELSKHEIVRELFEVLEGKREAGATYEELAALLKEPDWDIDIKDGTLKTLMSKVRTEKNIMYVNCPCCETKVQESQIKEPYRGVVQG